MLRLTPLQRLDLLYKPESGMGYQFVEATLPNDSTKSGVVYNAEILLWEEEPRYLLKHDYATLLRTAKSAATEIKSLRFDARRRTSTLNLRQTSTTKGGPAESAPKEKTKAGEVFVRFSAFENDHRIRDDRSLRAGSYATTEEDSKNVKTGKDAVSRYACRTLIPRPTSS